MCLTCGYTGCGRSNYDGTGGNGHAMKHHSSTNHPMVIKLGTISKSSSPSIHCYTCD